MKKILTGIQSSGSIHIGNILGALLPTIEMSKENDTFLFIADLHSLTTVKNAEELRNNTYSIASACLAFGFDYEKNTFYRQSDISEIGELSFMLNCITPYMMLAHNHTFKEKSDNLKDINVGLFTYPVLMASDILLFDTDVVPVGKDQKQHLEITRDIASIFNRTYGETFKLPEAKIKNTELVIGTDGRKMSKSYNNYIDIFLNEKDLRKSIMKIQTDSTPLEAPKNPDACILYKIYSSLLNDDLKADLTKKYLSGGIGYGTIKNEFYEYILSNYNEERKRFNYYHNNHDEIDRILSMGAIKAKAVASEVMNRVKKNIGLK